ncbi:MAG: hypothetical protein Q8K65_05300 [Alphaproteobacteria bacterium]|nr:hypothetical protein [Alphaproteobacteria bacterium]
MKRFLLVSLFLTMAALAAPATAQVSDAEAQIMMRNMPADEDGWAGGDEEGMGAEGPAVLAEEEPLFQEEQNPQDTLRRMPAPAPERAAQPQQR